MSELFDIILRTSLALLTLLVMTRIMGRKSVAQLSFFDYVIGITIGSVAASLAVDRTIGILNGLTSLVVATLWVLLINILVRSSLVARKLIESEPVMVIYQGKILEKNLHKKYYTVNDLLEQLREQGVFDPQEVAVAIAETDGELSILKKPQYQSATVNDLIPTQSGVALPDAKLVGKELIIDGKLIRDNLLASGRSEKWLQEQLTAFGVTQLENVSIALLTPQGTLYIDVKHDFKVSRPRA